MINSYDSHEGPCNPEEVIPLSEVKVKVRVKNKEDKRDEVEKCIENEYRRSIIIYSSKLPRKGWKIYVGVFFALAAGFFISVNVLLARLLRDRNQNYQPFTILLWRYVGNLPITLTILIYYAFRERLKLFRNIWPAATSERWMIHLLLILNGIFSLSSIALRYYSLEYLSLPDSAVIFYSSPVVVVILANFLLKEKCGLISILASFIALIGMGVISRPPFITGKEEFDRKILIGIGLATGGMVIQSLINIFIRKIREVNFSITMFTHAIFGTITSAVAASFGGILLPQTKYDWILATSLTISGFLIQLTMILALKFEEASRVTLLMCLEVIMSFIWQYFFLDTSLDIFSLAGSLIIILAVVITLVRKWLDTLPEKSKVRIWCCFLLK